MKESIIKTVPRRILENKLMEALTDDSVVAALFTKQDLEDIICAIAGVKNAEMLPGRVLDWSAFEERRKSLLSDLIKLRDGAFPRS